MSLLAMEQLFQYESEIDLVVLSGDQLTGLNILDNATKYWDQITSAISAHKVPHTAILGNHDAEPYSAHGGSNQSAPGAHTNRTQLIEHDMKDELSYTQLGPENLRPAVSVYVTDVFANESATIPALQILHLDSGGGGMMEEVYPAQIEWLNETLKERRERYGGPVQTLVFVHIPVEEFQTASSSPKCFGDHDDGITPTIKNNGLFQALRAQEEVRAVFVGHDHCNDFCCSYEDMELCFGRHSGFGGYQCDGYVQGWRVVEVTETSSSFQVDTYVRLVNGSKIHSGVLYKD